MSEAKSFRHTPGEWQKHPHYDGKLNCIANDDGSVRCYADAYVAVGEKVIAEVQMRTGNCGWPHVENMIEFNANLALMSAAPKMLDGLVKIVELMKAMDSNKSEVLVIAEDLIAKATTY